MLTWTRTPPTDAGVYFWGQWVASGAGLSWDGTYRWESLLVEVIRYGDGEPFVCGDPVIVRDYDHHDPDDDYVIRTSDYGGYWWPVPIAFPPQPLEEYGHHLRVDEDETLLTEPPPHPTPA
jgi:hypothetical protein